MYKTHYIKPLRNVRYGKTGIIYPNTLRIDIKGIVEYFAGQVVGWSWLGLSSAPVVTFNADDMVHTEIEELNIFLRHLGLTVAPLEVDDNG